jgi:hypothetical protein
MLARRRSSDRTRLNKPPADQHRSELLKNSNAGPGASCPRAVYIPDALFNAAPTEVAANRAPIRERYGVAIARFGPLLLFAVLIAVAGWRYRDWVNADGTFYIRRAMYIRWGMWPASVSAYWSPGLSWCIAALVTPFTDPVTGLHDARWVLALFGLLYVAASAVLLRRLLGRSRIALAAWGAATIAFCAVPLAAYKITPDLLLGFGLLAYLSIVLRDDFLRRPRRPILAGVATGAAFLCKAYALPFFLAHFTVTLIWHAWNAHHPARANGSPDSAVDGSGARVGKRVIISAILCVGVFALFAVPWIAVVSAKYHRLVISTVMAPNHAAVGPPEVLHRIPDAYAIPKAPFFSQSENPDTGPIPDWSPFESRAYFMHQIRVIIQHTRRLAMDQISIDFSGLTILAWLVSIALGAAALWQRRAIPACTWLAVTIAIYCSGFLIVAYETRYTQPILLPLGVALVLTTWVELPQWLKLRLAPRSRGIRLANSRPWQWVPAVTLALYAVGGALGIIPQDMPGSAVLLLHPANRFDAIVAQQINTLDLAWHYRIATSDVPRGNCVAYLSSRGLIAFPADHKMTVLSKKLADADVGVLIIWEVTSNQPKGVHQKLVEKFVRKMRWRQVRVIRMSNKFQAYLYKPRKPHRHRATQPAARATHAAPQ